jgi:hypothetical protein
MICLSYLNGLKWIIRKRVLWYILCLCRREVWYNKPKTTPSTGIYPKGGIKNKQLTHQSTYSVNLCTII